MAIVFAILGLFIVLIICICCLPKRIRRWRDRRRNSQLASDAENLNNPYTPSNASHGDAGARYYSPDSMQESGRYAGVSNAAWNRNNAANDPSLLSPTYTVGSGRARDPHNNYIVNDHNVAPSPPYGSSYNNFHMDQGTPQMPQPAASQDMAGPYPSFTGYQAGGSSSGVNRRDSTMSRRRSGSAGSGMGKKIRQFMYRPNSTLTEHERREAAGTLSRIESLGELEDDRRPANRLRGGAPISGSSYSSDLNAVATYSADGHAPEQSPPIQGPLPPRPLKSPPRPPQERQQQNSPPHGSPRSSPSKNTARTFGTGPDDLPQSPQSPYGKRPRGDSDAEMSRLVDLLVSRSSLPGRPQTGHLASRTSLESNYSSANYDRNAYRPAAAMGSSGLLPRVGEHRDEDDGAASTFGTESILSSRGPSHMDIFAPPLPKVAITPATPMDLNKRLRERWYGKPI